MPAPQPDLLGNLRAQLDELVQANVAGLKELSMRGIQFDPGQILNGRIDSVIESLATAMGPQGIIWSLQCRINFERQMAEQIEVGKREGAVAILAQGGSFTPETIRQMARQTGTYGGR